MAKVDDRKSVYISGPMTGYPLRNKPAFMNAQNMLEDMGFKCINPFFCNAEEFHGQWVKCMKNDIKALVDCDHIYMLEGWEKSKGATFEKLIADKLEISELFIEAKK